MWYNYVMHWTDKLVSFVLISLQLSGPVIRSKSKMEMKFEFSMCFVKLKYQHPNDEKQELYYKGGTATATIG